MFWFGLGMVCVSVGGITKILLEGKALYEAELRASRESQQVQTLDIWQDKP